MEFDGSMAVLAGVPLDASYSIALETMNKLPNPLNRDADPPSNFLIADTAARQENDSCVFAADRVEPLSFHAVKFSSLRRRDGANANLIHLRSLCVLSYLQITKGRRDFSS